MRQILYGPRGYINRRLANKAEYAEAEANNGNNAFADFLIAIAPGNDISTHK